jgi:hypothetical protein
LIGLGKRRRLRVDQPTITGRTHPAPDARSPLFACLCRSIRRTQTAGLSAFFLETEARWQSIRRCGRRLSRGYSGRSRPFLASGMLCRNVGRLHIASARHFSWAALDDVVRFKRGADTRPRPSTAELNPCDRRPLDRQAEELSELPSLARRCSIARTAYAGDAHGQEREDA